MELKVMHDVNSGLVAESLSLKYKSSKLKESISDLKKALDSLGKDHKKEVDEAKLLYIIKQRSLIQIINSLKQKLN